ncbi:MAG: N-acetylmuramoyl-L-alanine amidase [Oscillospiraceae bacterium]|nr:N-acetylmuramoyl-L-alanine amidase [Oscillospiraceae bacterium]
MAKRRVRWDRIALVAIPLFVIILLIATQCTGKSNQNQESSAELSVQSIADTAPTLNQGEFVVVIDAGHGGYDGGSTAQGVTRLEKDDNLRLALKMKEKLSTYQGVTILMTRETDEFIGLQERCDIANHAGADLFVSLHRNCADVGYGVEVWVDNAEDRIDNLLAEYILELLEDVGISRNRGKKYGFRGVSDGGADNHTDSYYVNANTDMPSCLVELGFLTAEQDNINFDTHLEEYAEALARAVIELGTDEGMYHPASLQ